MLRKGVAARATALLADVPPDAPCSVPECTLLCWRQKRLTEAAAVGVTRGVRLASAALLVLGLVVLTTVRARRR